MKKSRSKSHSNQSREKSRKHKGEDKRYDQRHERQQCHDRHHHHKQGQRHNYHKSERGDWNRDRHNNNESSRRDNRNRNNSYGRYNSNPRPNNAQSQKKVLREVFDMEIDAPKQFTLSYNWCQNSQKQYQVKIVDDQKYPIRVEESKLGQLKNKITPIQKLWGSHIKQYLNISQFVEIFRPWKSLAYGNIQYGKTIINYQEEPRIMQYDNEQQQTQIFSRAYFKLWEILETGVLNGMQNQEMSIGCVAEGPGGFIHALVDYRIRQQKGQLRRRVDTYNSITLKIDGDTRNAKDWSDHRGTKLFKRLRDDAGQRINLSYGATGTGDLLKPQNILYFSKQVKHKCQLVTGDGGIECIGDKQFQYQEIFNSKLFLGEIITALHIQDKGGKFILKIYDIGFQISRQLIMLLGFYYQKVRIIKPITSRPGNSEKYLLCQGFKGISEQDKQKLMEVLKRWTQIQPKLSYFENVRFVHNLFDFSALPDYEKVYNSIKEANDWFVEEQMQKIQEGLQLCEKHEGSGRNIETELKSSRWQEQMSFAYRWCKKYGIVPIEVVVKRKGEDEVMNE